MLPDSTDSKVFLAVDDPDVPLAAGVSTPYTCAVLEVVSASAWWRSCGRDEFLVVLERLVRVKEYHTYLKQMKN